MTEFGRLEVFAGPMFAGKTESLIREYLFLQHMGACPVIYKPRHDTRYDADKIVSHSGGRIEATAITSWPGNPGDEVKAVMFEECQFFIEPFFDGDLLAIVRGLRARGVSVFAAGLDMDWQSQGFDVTARLMAESTRINRLTARCEVCGGAASMTAKRGGGEGRFDVGGADLYFPACHTHWSENYHRQVLQTSAA